MKFNFNQVDEIVSNIARKYSRNTSIEFEDFYQDLWVKAIEIDTDNMALMTTSLVNKAIDMSRKNWSEMNHQTDSHDNWEIDDREKWLYQNASSNMKHNTMNIDGYLTLIENIDKLSPRTRIFAISKICLNSDDQTFYNEFVEIIHHLSDEKKETLKNYKKQSYTDDVILKVFCDIKTGVNSGTARSIKNELLSVLLG